MVILVVVMLGCTTGSNALTVPTPCALGECERCVDWQWGSVDLCYPNYGWIIPDPDPILCTHNCQGVITDEGWRCCKVLTCICGETKKSSTNYSTCEALCDE